jgi:cytochrome P450
MTDIFVAKSAEVRIMLFTSRKCINRGTQQLKDCLLEQVAASPQPGQAKVEITSWLTRATLDIIGLAGFNYSFDALKFGEDSNELGYAFTQLFNNAEIASLVNILHGYFPFLRWIVRLPILLLTPQPDFTQSLSAPLKQKVDQQSKMLSGARRTMRRIGLQLVREKQQAVLDEQASDGATALEKGKNKDLLSLLVKANMDKNLPAGQQLSLEQILNQIPTFLVSGMP